MKVANSVRTVVLKLANSCNINCGYCYWFKDLSVYSHSKLIREDVLSSFYDKLRKHLIESHLKSFTIILHGGEPLLIGKKRMEQVLFNIYKIQVDLEIPIYLTIQTNGLLLDNDWVDLLYSYRVSIGISVDGPKEVNDQNRLDFKGNSTYDRTIDSIKLLQYRNIPFGVLSVCNPLVSAEKLCSHFIDELKLRKFDVLIPNVNYDSHDKPDIRGFYKDLYRLWFTNYRHKGVSIKLLGNVLLGLQGGDFKMQSIGLSREESVMIKPDGEIEASDSLHSVGNNFTASRINILTHDLNQIQEDILWKEVYESSVNLNSTCLTCKYKTLCGGGHICNRWSTTTRFDNPSVFCEELFELFESAEQLLEENRESVI